MVKLIPGKLYTVTKNKSKVLVVIKGFGDDGKTLYFTTDPFKTTTIDQLEQKPILLYVNVVTWSAAKSSRRNFFAKFLWDKQVLYIKDHF